MRSPALFILLCGFLACEAMSLYEILALTQDEKNRALCIETNKSQSNMTAIKILIECGADINTQQDIAHAFPTTQKFQYCSHPIIIEGCTPLMYAAYSRNANALKLLLAQPTINIELRSAKNEETALLIAARDVPYSIDTARILLKDGARGDRIAAQETNYNKETAHLLLKSGAHADVEGKDGETSLSHICLSSNNFRNLSTTCQALKEFAQILLEYGANPELLLNNPSIHENIAPEIRNLLAQSKDSIQYKILRATYCNNLVIAQSLMLNMSPEEINAVYADKKTLLMVAASRGYNELVKYLLKNGANYTRADCNGETAWHHARKNNNIQTTRLLERYAHAFIREILLRNRFSNKQNRENQLPYLPTELKLLIGSCILRLSIIGYQRA